MTRRKEKKGLQFKKEEKKALQIFAVLLMCSLFVGLGSNIYFLQTINKFDKGTIIGGVYIGSTDVSHLTAKEAKKKLEEQIAALSGAELTLDLQDGRQAVLTPADLQMTIKDMDELIAEAEDYGKTGNTFECFRILKTSGKGGNKKVIPMSYEIPQDHAKKVFHDKFQGVLTEPVNANLMVNDDYSVSVIDEQPGELIDISRTSESIEDFLNDDWKGESGTVDAFLSDSQAEVTADDLKDMTDVLGTYTTYYGSDGSGRAQNIEVGTQLITDVILQPGEEYSVSHIMGPNTIENGFAEANSYEGDKIVTSVGGGVCQVASTLYNAVLLSELEVTERAPHSLPVSYVQPSMDAAIAENLLDLKFVNNYPAPIYIQGVLSGGYLTFNIYGQETRSPERSIEYVSEITGEEYPDKKNFKAVDKEIGTIYTESEAKPAVSARLFKVVYDNGTEVSRDIVNYSQYLDNEEVVAVGTYSEDPEATKKMQEAIDSQDEEKIYAVIDELTKKEETTGE